MKDIAEAIKEKRTAILRLQTELDVLERARALLNGGAMDQPISQPAQAPRKSKMHPLKGRFSPKSGVGHAVTVLREAGVPLHIDEIIARVKKRGYEAKKTSLGSTLAKLSKQGRIFCRTQQPNTFALLDWVKAAGQV